MAAMRRSPVFYLVHHESRVQSSPCARPGTPCWSSRSRGYSSSPASAPSRSRTATRAPTPRPPARCWSDRSWITPTLGGAPRFAKPAFVYWLMAGAYAVLGVGETAARLPSAVAALLLVLVQYAFARWAFGPSVAWRAALVLLLSIEYVAIGRMALTDATWRSGRPSPRTRSSAGGSGLPPAGAGTPSPGSRAGSPCSPRARSGSSCRSAESSRTSRSPEASARPGEKPGPFAVFCSSSWSPGPGTWRCSGCTGGTTRLGRAVKRSVASSGR